MRKFCYDITNLQAMLFERKQIVSLINDTSLWGLIPLEQRFALVESGEFMTLMGESFTEHMRNVLEVEAEARLSTIN